MGSLFCSYYSKEIYYDNYNLLTLFKIYDRIIWLSIRLNWSLSPNLIFIRSYEDLNLPYDRNLKIHNQQWHPCRLYIIHYRLLLHYRVLWLKRRKEFPRRFVERKIYLWFFHFDDHDKVVELFRLIHFFLHILYNQQNWLLKFLLILEQLNLRYFVHYLIR
jgi:hypothetical protein